MAMLNLSKYDHIRKKLIHSGSPSLYQLKLKKEKTGGVTKLTLGQKDPKKSNRTILLVGETGTGKSTLINALTNYAMGVKWEDNVWFKIVQGEDGKAQSESQTSDVIVYEIFGFEDEPLPYSLTIIDTPGYGDTRGTEKDDIVTKRLHDLFRSENGVHEINVVGLVLKATENRLNERARYIFDSVVSLFANDMEENIVCLFTHSDGFEPEEALGALKAANIQCAKDENDELIHFLFSNRQKDDQTEDEDILEQTEQRTTEALKKFSDFLEKAAPQNLSKTVEVLNSRIRLTACIKNLKERVEMIELKQREVKQIQDALRKYEEEMKRKEKQMKSKEEDVKRHQTETQQTQEALKKHEEELKSNKNFIVEVDEPYKDKQSIKGGQWGFLWLFYEGATCCTVCEENCHYPECTMAWYPRDCVVMKKDRCTVCTGKCPVSAHVKEEWIYVTKTRKVQKTLQDVKEKYESDLAHVARAKTQLEYLEKTKIDQGDLEDVKKKYDQSKAVCEDQSDVFRGLEMEMKKLQEEKDRWLDDAFQHVVKLEQMALKADSMSTHVLLDFLIEKMKEKGDREKTKKLEEIEKRGGEEAKKGLTYKGMAMENLLMNQNTGRKRKASQL